MKVLSIDVRMSISEEKKERVTDVWRKKRKKIDFFKASFIED